MPDRFLEISGGFRCATQDQSGKVNLSDVFCSAHPKSFRDVGATLALGAGAISQ